METLLVDVDGPIGFLTFNRPERRNAVNLAMWQAIPPLVAAFDGDPRVRVIVLRGAGDEAFASGADITEFEQHRHDSESGRTYVDATTAAFRAIRNAKKPTVAMVRGYCVGGGCAIALNCDLRVCADDARFAVPTARLGIAYEYEGIQQIVQLLGAGFAREMLFTGRTYDAFDAERIGLVHRRVSVAELLPFTRDYAQTIAGNAPLSIRYAKLCIDECLRAPANRDEGVISAAAEACFASDDYHEGFSAFLEKRRPSFTGR